MATAGTVTKNGTRVYASPSKSAKVLTTMSYGNAIQIVSTVTNSEGKWRKITYIYTSDSQIDYATVKVDKTAFYSSTSLGPTGQSQIAGWCYKNDQFTACTLSGSHLFGTLTKTSLDNKSYGKKGYILTSQVNIVYKRMEEAYIEYDSGKLTNDETISPTKATISTSTTGYGTFSSNTHKFTGGEEVMIVGSGKGQYRVTYEGTTYTVNASVVTVGGSQTQATVSSNDVTPVATSASTSVPTAETYQETTATAVYQSRGFTDTNPDWNQVFAGVDGLAAVNDGIYDDDYYRKLGFKYFNALGYPPKYNMDIDLQYTGANSAGTDSEEVLLTGRVMSKTVMSNPPILSICPGTVKMFPNLIGVERENFIEAMASAAAGNADLVQKILADDSSLFSGKLYQFEADTKSYAYYVNALCRACAILLKIGDEKAPWTGAPLKTFDYSYWTLRSRYNEAAASGADGDKSMFRNFWPNLLSSASRIYTSLVEDTTYINFFLNGGETQVSESITTGVSDGPLSGLFNTVNDLANSINYFTGSGFTYGSDDSAVSEALRNALNTGNSTLDGIVDLGKNFMQGGKIILPKMVSGAEYGKSISCSTKFVSPYGDPYSVFLRCIVPVCHLLALALPKQLSDNMYTYPFLIKANQVGQFHVDLGVISNISISRGGSDDTSWTVDGLATEWDVQFEITPLVDELMLTGTNHPGLFCKNENLIDYLGNFCGFDLLANNFNTKAELARSFINNYFTGIPRSIENRVTDTLFNKLAGLSKVAWG